VYSSAPWKRITVSPDDLEKLLDDASRGANATISIDLEAKEIRGPDGGVVKFDLDEFKRHCLLNGLDDIGLTLQRETEIATYESTHPVPAEWKS
jgi:3-isopropylmalate/(R)-2-methylmalate dehydratase small subunit